MAAVDPSVRWALQPGPVLSLVMRLTRHFQQPARENCQLQAMLMRSTVTNLAFRLVFVGSLAIFVFRLVSFLFIRLSTLALLRLGVLVK